MKKSPIFARTYDLLLWLIPQMIKFPRSQRFVLGRAIQEAALEFQQRILEASLGPPREQEVRLAQADVALARLRVSLRLCHDLEILGSGQYEHVSRMVAEIGRLLGGWKRSQGVPDVA